MKEIFANGDVGLIGLMFFFAFFILMLVWLFQPGKKEIFAKYGNIPLKDGNDE